MKRGRRGRWGRGVAGPDAVCFGPVGGSVAGGDGAAAVAVGQRPALMINDTSGLAGVDVAGSFARASRNSSIAARASRVARGGMRRSGARSWSLRYRWNNSSAAASNNSARAVTCRFQVSKRSLRRRGVTPGAPPRVPPSPCTQRQATGQQSRARPLRRVRVRCRSPHAHATRPTCGGEGRRGDTGRYRVLRPHRSRGRRSGRRGPTRDHHPTRVYRTRVHRTRVCELDATTQPESGSTGHRFLRISSGGAPGRLRRARSRASSR